MITVDPVGKTPGTPPSSSAKTYGKGTKTYTKFDDDTRSLYLEVKLFPSDNWLRITPAKARELIVESTSKELRDLQKRMQDKDSHRLHSNTYDD